jgi:hypothetical protein
MLQAAELTTRLHPDDEVVIARTIVRHDVMDLSR